MCVCVWEGEGRGGGGGGGGGGEGINATCLSRNGLRVKLKMAATTSLQARERGEGGNKRFPVCLEMAIMYHYKMRLQRIKSSL